MVSYHLPAARVTPIRLGCACIFMTVHLSSLKCYVFADVILNEMYSYLNKSGATHLNGLVIYWMCS